MSDIDEDQIEQINEDDLDELMSADELKQLYKIGNFNEPEKNRLMMEDLEKK